MHLVIPPNFSADQHALRLVPLDNGVKHPTALVNIAQDHVSLVPLAPQHALHVVIHTF